MENNDCKESADSYLHRTGVIDLFQALTVSLLHEQPQNPVDYIIGCIRHVASNRRSGHVGYDSLITCHTSSGSTGGNANGEGVLDAGGVTDSQQKHSTAMFAADRERGGRRDSSRWREILSGRLDNLPPLPSNIVRIFLSSTFSDFKAERTVLPRDAYPQLQQFCSRRGLDFQVVDMRWGVTDEMVNDHMTSAICLREITLCQELSQGPCFVAMLGHRYGYQPLPSAIPADEFTNLVKLCEEMSAASLLLEWYIRDDNSVPPVYCLQPITDKIPAYADFTKPDEQIKAKALWKKVYRHIQSVLRSSSELACGRGLIGEETKRTYFMSVTEEEIRQGILQYGPTEEHALCYVRELEGIKSIPFTNKLAARYLDILEEEVLDDVAQELLSELVKDKIPSHLTPDHLKAYSTKWTGTPLESSTDAEHVNYLDRFSLDFVKDVQAMISEKTENMNFNEVPKEILPVYLEVLLHAKFCLKKCEVFCGRQQFINQVIQYVNSLDQPHLPLVIHGQSGYGKTSLLAHIGRSIKEWVPSVEHVVIRFLGTSPGSSSIKSTLVSLTQQLCVFFGYDIKQVEQLELMSDVRKEFTQTLKKAGQDIGKDKKLLIILDSIDQLSTDFGSHQMHWLPRFLPNSVGIVLSMLNDRYNCYNAAKERLRDENAFVKLSELPSTTGENIVVEYLTYHNRKITEQQHIVLMKTFSFCQQPLFLKLLLDEAREWKSYNQPTEMELMTTIQAAINHLFQKVEDKFGCVFVKAALGYLTCGKDGLTGIEMEDALSCDNEVLNAVYVFHDPPLADVIRIPPLLWARLQNEIKEYLVERKADGKSVMAWYHRLFWETASSRYVEPPEKKKALHTTLAGIFRSEGTVKKTIVLKNRGNLTITDADRQVSPQPLTTTNARKLNALPYHLYHSHQFDELKYRCLLDFDWLLTKIKAVSIREVVSEFERFCNTEPLSNDSTVCLMRDFLNLAYEPLKDDPHQFAYQILERITLLTDRYPSTTTLVESAKLWIENATIPILLPVHNTNLRSPESCLIYSVLAGNTGFIHPDGEIAVCGFFDKVSGIFKVQIWNLLSKDVVESIPSKPTHHFVLSGDSTVMAIVTEDMVSVYDTASGDLLRTFRYRDDKFFKCYIKSICLDEKGETLLVGAKLGYRARGDGLKYRSDIHRVNVTQEIARQVEYSSPGSRSLERIILAPGGKQFVVVDFTKIVFFDILSLRCVRAITKFPIVKADTFSFTASGDILLGSIGGYHDENSKAIAIHTDNDIIEVSGFLFDCDAKDTDSSSVTEESSESDSDQTSDPQIARAFAFVSREGGDLAMIGLSSIGANRRNCVAVWTRPNNETRCLVLPSRPERFPKCLAAFPDWTLGIVGWDDGLLMFINIITMEFISEMKGHELSVNILQILPRRDQMVSIGTDRNLKVWDIRHLRREVENTAPKEPRVEGVLPCLDEKEQAVDYACTDSVVVTVLPYPTSPPKAWETDTSQPCQQLNLDMESSYRDLYPVQSNLRKDASLTIIQGGRYLVDVRRRRGEAVAHILDLTDGGKVVTRFDTFNPHLIYRERYFMTCMLGELIVRQLPTGAVSRVLKMSPWPEELIKDHINNPPQIALTFDDTHLLFAHFVGSERYLEVVNLETFTIVNRTQFPTCSPNVLSEGICYLTVLDGTSALLCPPDQLPSPPPHHSFSGIIKTRFVSPRGNYGVILHSSTNSFTMWSTEAACKLYVAKGLQQKVHCVCFSPNERFLLTGSYTVVAVWAVQTGRTLYQMQTYGAVCDLSFSPSGGNVFIQCYAAPKHKRLIICKALRMK